MRATLRRIACLAALVTLTAAPSAARAQEELEGMPLLLSSGDSGLSL